MARKIPPALLMIQPTALPFKLLVVLLGNVGIGMLPAQPPALLPPPSNTTTAPTPNTTLPAIPARPASHLLDESGMFSETEAKALSSRLLSSQTRTGLGLYLCIHTYLADETADSRARRTHATWLEGSGAGIIVVHDRSTGRLSFAGSDDKRMPDADALRALYRLADATSKSLPPEAEAPLRLRATLITLADGLEAWQKNGRLPALPVVVAPPRTVPNPSATPPIGAPWTKPNTFFIDEAFVSTDLTIAANLRQRLETWHRETGLSLYVVTVTYPPESAGLPLAEKLVSEWLPDTMGGVIVYDRSRPETLSFAGTPQADRWLSPGQLETLYEAALGAALSTGENPAQRLDAATTFLMNAYARDGLPILRESQRWLPKTQRHYLPWILAGFALCAGVLYFFQRWQERADRRRRTVFLFPEVFVTERLGAPHGGGVTAEVGGKPAPSITPP